MAKWRKKCPMTQLYSFIVSCENQNSTIAYGWRENNIHQHHQTRKVTISSKHPNEQKCTNSYIYLTKTICGLSGYFAFVFASCVLNVERTPEPSPGSRVCPCPNFRTQGDSTSMVQKYLIHSIHTTFFAGQWRAHSFNLNWNKWLTDGFSAKNTNSYVNF